MREKHETRIRQILEDMLERKQRQINDAKTKMGSVPTVLLVRERKTLDTLSEDAQALEFALKLLNSKKDIGSLVRAIIHFSYRGADSYEKGDEEQLWRSWDGIKRSARRIADAIGESLEAEYLDLD